jgi:DNA-binding IclR family transcriptional regulator
MTRTITSVTNAFDIIKHIRRHGGATVSKVAAEMDLTPSTVHTYLATLREANYVVKEGGAYRLGPQLLTLGEFVRHHDKLFRAAKEQVEELAEETGESVHLIIEHDGKLFGLYERFGENAVGIEYHNRKREQPLNHLHCTAAGKAILSELPDDEVEGIVEKSGMPRNTNQTITDRDRLLEELETLRERGYAQADEEQMEGLRAVGAPVVTPQSGVVGAIAVSGPTARLSGERFEEYIPEMVVQAANICEINLQTVAAVGEEPA